MKKVFVLLLLISACKKKSVEPDSDPNKTVSVTCQAMPRVFSGMWVCPNSPNDTLTFLWTRDNCPTNGQNFYKMVNFAKIANPHLPDPYKNDPEMKADETGGKGIGEVNAPYTFIQIVTSSVTSQFMIVTQNNKSISFKKVK